MKLVIKKMTCPSVNTIYNMHHYKRNTVKRDIGKIVWGYAMQNRKQFKKVRLFFTAYYKDKRIRDPDNLYVKPMIDGLVDAGIIKDDSSEFVESVTLKIVTGAEENCVIIEIL